VRGIRLLLIALAVLLFLAVSALLARALSVDGAERAAIVQLVHAETRGDSSAMVRLLSGCRPSPSCRASAAQEAATLRHPGAVSIVQVNPSAGFSLTGTRVVWQAGSQLPVVQCVRVRRAGNVISGLQIELLSISRRIKTSAACPGAGGSGI
jgi:hypothetical protein